MERLLMDSLVKWKTSKNRKPLILWGARQVGKTFLMKAFGERHFKSLVYISFYNNKKMAELFERDYNPKRIITAIETISKAKIKEETLLIFDEIQNAPKVVESLKYFCEESPQIPVICAGSLLGVALHQGISFPVGKVNELHLYPMSFKEFLMAKDEVQMANWIESPNEAFVSDLTEKYLEHLKEYLVVGGMPEVVDCYINENDYDRVRELQLSILSHYEGDFGKHVKAKELPRIHMAWSSIPLQLSKENKKFFFGKIKAGARAKEFEIALQWLLDAGLIYKVCKMQKPSVPLKSYVDLNAFKIYMLDVGLLGAMAEVEYESILSGDGLFTEFKGAMAEQFVLQELKAKGRYEPYYYSGEKSTYEVDFLIQKKGGIVPIEVKSAENTKSKSLRFFCEKFKPKTAYRTSTKAYKDQGWMENIPIWSVWGI